MDDIILLKIVISFFVGGGVILLVTYLSEKFGSVLGALLAGSPTTLAISLLFQGIAIDTQAVVAACGPALVGLSVFGLFCSSYIYLARYNFIVSLIGAVLAWLFVMLIFIVLEIQEMRACFIISIMIAGVSKWVLDHKKIEELPFVKKQKNFVWVYVLRFVIGGGMISFSVLMGVVAGEVVGGVFAAFPALAVSNILILNHSMGRNFTVNFVKNLFESAMPAITLYILAVYFLYSPLGLFWGTVFAYLLSIMSIYMVYRLKKLRS